MLRNKSIICFAGEDWWYHHPHSKNHIMRRFAKAENKVVFVNSISMGLPSIGSKEFFAKVRRKLASYAKAIRVADDGIVVVSPIALPFYGSSFARWINRVFLTLQIKLLMVALDLREPLLWIAIPTAASLVGRLSERLLIYQVSDKYDRNQMDHATSSSLISEMHEALLDKADIVYYSGRKLFEEEVSKEPRIASKAKLLEQAVDFDHFASATERTDAQPADISRIGRPRLGYFGAIETWLLDQQLIRYVSQKRPDWQWVLLGLKATPLEVETLANVHHLGSRPYADMPRYASEFDVCVLPWVTDNEFVSYGSAIKVREYLATGKPVVMTPLYEYERLDGILRIARSYDDFISKIEDALNCDTLAQREARQQAVRDSTWDVRAEQISRDIEQLLERARLKPGRSN